MTNEERAEKLVVDITGDKRQASSLASVGYVLSFADEIRRECDKEYVTSMMKIIAHTGLPPNPSKVLLLGLIDSIKRIACAAIMGRSEG